MSLTVETFTKNARLFCQWAESDAHDVETARQLLPALIQGVLHLAPSTGKDAWADYPRRTYRDWQADQQRFSDFPFLHYRELSPCDLNDKPPSIGDIRDDLADIYGDLWHGLQALDRGDGVYAAGYWRESYVQHWGHHASAAMYAMDEFCRKNAGGNRDAAQNVGLAAQRGDSRLAKRRGWTGESLAFVKTLSKEWLGFIKKAIEHWFGKKAKTDSNFAINLILIVLFLFFTGVCGILLIGSSLSTHPFRMLAAFMCFLAAASIIARPIASFIAKVLSVIIYPGDAHAKPPPAYGQAETRRIRGDYEAAIRLFDAIVTDHPQEIHAWLSMMEIALDNLRNPILAQDILDRGLTVLTKDSNRNALQKYFGEGMELLKKQKAPPAS